MLHRYIVLAPVVQQCRTRYGRWDDHIPMKRTMATILVVASDINTRDALAAELALHRFGVQLAASGSEALAVARRCHPNVVLVDSFLPDTSGLEIVRCVKRLDSGTRAIVMTTLSTVRGAIDAMRAGASDYLETPVDTSSLLSAISACWSLCGRQVHDRQSPF